MRTHRLFEYIAIAAGALAPAACEVSPPASEAGAVSIVAPRDIPAGTIEAPESAATPQTQVTPVAPEETRAPRALRPVPETYEIAPPATPTHRDEAPTDGMPVLDAPAHDGMPSVTPLPGAPSDPMPVVGPLAGKIDAPSR